MGCLFFLLLLFYNLSQFPFPASADDQSFGLGYNGGTIMTEPITVNIIWFGKIWDINNQAALRNAVNSLSPSRYQNNQESLVPTLGDWWEIVRQYHDGSKNSVSGYVKLGAECYYTGRELLMTEETVLEVGRSVFNETAILESFQGNLTCSKTFDLNDRSIYHVVFSSDVKFTEGNEETAFRELCRGKLTADQVSNGMSVDIIWAREPLGGEDDQCSTYFRGTSFLGPPNGDEKMDSLIGHMLLNIAEVATNKDGKGWKSNDGNELTVGSSCASAVRQNDADGPPLFSDSQRNYSFNTVGLNGYRYIIRYIWDQNVRNCALKLSERCSTKAFREPNGRIKAGIIVNHTDGLQPYPPNQRCQWNVEYDTAKFISFTLSMTAAEDNRIKLCEHGSHPRCQSMRLIRNNYGNSFKVRGSKAVVRFNTDNQVPFSSRGWELNYSVGICDGAEDIYNRLGTIGYTSPGGSSYMQGVNCQWILHGKPGTPVTLNFTEINITKDFDFVAVFNGSMWEKANFSGSYSGSDLPQLNLTGKVTIAFVTQTNNGKGWSANFHIASPVDPNGKKLLVAIIVASAMAIFSMAMLVFVFITKKRKKNMTKLEKDLLLRAGIKWDEIIGEGTSSIVYKAISTDGTVMAVKRPRYVVSQQKLEEEILARASSHPNIITLMGYGEDTVGGRCLVFEYMSNGSLRKNLEENGEEIDWEKRLDIAIQISKAIQMLHTYMMPPVYHGNITSDNVLINDQYIAKLSGFGAANYCTISYTSLGMPLEMENDICNLGLLLVELLRGEKAVIRNNYGSSEYSEEINQLIFGQDCLDQRLIIPEEESKTRGLAKLGEIAKWCLSENHGIEREVTIPKIGDVLSALKQVKQSF